MADLVAITERMLARSGETVLLRRRIGTGSTFVEVTCRARLTGYQPEQLTGSITQAHSAFILGPQGINDAVIAGSWPGAAGGGFTPKVGDFIRSNGGADRRIEAIQPVRIGNEVFRYEGRILG